MSEFPAAPMDRGTRAVTVATVVLVLGVLVILAGLGELGWLLWLLVPLHLAILLGAWALAPRAFQVRRRELTVIRNAWRPLAVRVARLTEVPEPQKFGLRAVGSGGAFGWYGRFRRRDIGGYRLYATTRVAANLVAMQTDEGTVIVVSPADPEGFRSTLAAVVR